MDSVPDGKNTTKVKVNSLAFAYCAKNGISKDPKRRTCFLQRQGQRKEEIPMDQNILLNLDEALKESLEKVFQLLEEKKYFQAKDELLKYNGYGAELHRGGA